MNASPIVSILKKNNDKDKDKDNDNDNDKDEDKDKDKELHCESYTGKARIETLK